jgi:hypothetical protein
MEAAMNGIPYESQMNSAGRRGSCTPNEGFERRMMFYAIAAGAGGEATLTIP